MVHLRRLYFKSKLIENTAIELESEKIHYIKNVIRSSVGDSIRLFNDIDGEFRATIEMISKKIIKLEVKEKIKEVPSFIPLYLAFGILKSDSLMFLLEKATELGVTHFFPLQTDRTNGRFNKERARKQILDAIIQSERFFIPEIHDIKSLGDFLKSNTILNTQFFSCIERLDTDNKNNFTKSDQEKTLGLIVGPEGGWSEKERNLLLTSQLPSLSFGNHILRAETAAICGLSLLQFSLLINGELL
jgi:16S rRNA (uracil1498-N3)-methyltransferase